MKRSAITRHEAFQSAVFQQTMGGVMMKIFERWECNQKLGSIWKTYRLRRDEDKADPDLSRWLDHPDRKPGDTHKRGVALYVCVADELVYELMVEGNKLHVVDENGQVKDSRGLTPGSIACINLSQWKDSTSCWQGLYGIPVETTLRAVLDYYHKEFCGDSAGEVDGE